MNVMELIRTVDKTHQDNPIEGDLGVDNNGILFMYKAGKWKGIGKPVITSHEDVLINKRRKMYQNGIRHYFTNGDFQIRMTIRPDGTEYIDKADMPA